MVLKESEQATNIYSGMKKRYPNRKLIPFAKRVDNDDTACFEIGKGSKVQLIHDFASEGFEQRKDKHPIILEVNTEKAREEGVKFYLGNEKVWLADEIPSEFIAINKN